MLKRLTLKLITLSVFVVALSAVASAPASSANSHTLICVDMPEGCLGNQKYCCDPQTNECGCYY
jgi:hypothetical protein